MWLPCEIIDDSALKFKHLIVKGSQITCIGSVVTSKWIDKNTNEERKKFLMKVENILTQDQFQNVLSTIQPLLTPKFENNEHEMGDKSMNDNSPQRNIDLWESQDVKQISNKHKASESFKKSENYWDTNKSNVQNGNSKDNASMKKKVKPFSKKTSWDNLENDLSKIAIQEEEGLNY